jgi:hypothetical protein
MPLFVLPDAPSSLVVVVGVNHRATGNGHCACASPFALLHRSITVSLTC